MNPTVAKLWTMTIAIALVFAAFLFRDDKEFATQLLKTAMAVAAGLGVGWQWLRRAGDVPASSLSAPVVSGSISDPEPEARDSTLFPVDDDAKTLPPKGPSDG